MNSYIPDITSIILVSLNSLEHTIYQ